MNKFKMLLVFGLVSCAVVNAAETNNFDEDYNEGLVEQPQGQSWSDYFKSWMPFGRKDNKDKAEVADMQEEVAVPAITKNPEMRKTESALNGAKIRLQSLLNRASNNSESIRGYAHGALYALSNGDVAQAADLVQAALQFIENERADGRDQEMYAKYQDSLSAILNMLQ